MTPAPPPRPSPRAQHAERNVRLDPQGIYGTRSARRQNQLRRRRQFQNGLLWLFGAVALMILMRSALQPRHSARAASQIISLPFRPAGSPIALRDGALLFTSQSGALWRFQSGKDPLLAAPRRLFVEAFAPAAALLVTPRQIFWPGGDGTLVALDAVSNREQWRAKLSSALVARPALAQVDGRLVLIAGDDAGHIAAFDARTGVLLWNRVLGGALGAGIGVLGSQDQAGKKLGSGVLVPLLAGAGSRGGLVCLDAKTGATRWRFPGDERSQSAGPALPASLGNRVFWCNDEGAVVCLNGATGRKIWKNFAAPQDEKPNGEKAQGEKPNQESGELVMLRGAPTIVEAAKIVAVGGNDGILRAFDLATGQPRWAQNLGGALRFAAQKLKFEGKNALLVTGEMPAIWLLDAQDGAVVRQWTTPHHNSYGLASTPDNAFALDAQGHLQIAPLQ